MIEVTVQMLVVEAVRAHGGEARKLSNRFNIGVSDLLIKLKDEAHLDGKDVFPAMLMEVKLDKRAAGLATRMNNSVVPDVTVPQHSFLTRFARAGMLCGVMSFVEEAGRGKRGLWLQIVKVPGYRARDALMTNKYVQLSPLTSFDRIVVEMLKEFAQ